ncbi:Ferritin-like metal-binding protein YciE [Ensifer adhaerens]|nr:Ferritin-like metal-binding protein YciE [Ensifer adhaerens]
MAENSQIRDIFVTGLRNAHAMENQALSIMKPQLSRIENYPEVAQRLEVHIRETEGQLKRLATILDALGEGNSTLKDTALSITGSLAALGHAISGDEILKNSFANSAFENYEIAAYQSLITVAAHGGFSSAVETLRTSLDEEIAMARWLNDNLERLTLKFVARRQADLTAKV